MDWGSHRGHQRRIRMRAIILGAIKGAKCLGAKLLLVACAAAWSAHKPVGTRSRATGSDGQNRFFGFCNRTLVITGGPVFIFVSVRRRSRGSAPAGAKPATSAPGKRRLQF
jgi:hypothetical protein